VKLYLTYYPSNDQSFIPEFPKVPPTPQTCPEDSSETNSLIIIHALEENATLNYKQTI
jgi:hypothetical protein